MIIEEIHHLHPNGYVNLFEYDIRFILADIETGEDVDLDYLERIFLEIENNNPNKDWIWFEYWHGFDYTRYFEVIDSICDKFNIDKSKIYFYIADLKIEKYKKFNFKVVPNLLVFRSYYSSHTDNKIFNRVNYNIKNKIYVQGGRKSESRNYIKESLEKLEVDFIHTIRQDGTNAGGSPLDVDDLFDLFDDSFLYISTESNEVFLNRNIKDKKNFYFTEKTAIPLSSYRPFLIVGGYGYIDWLKKLGFKTFDKWWDESYQYSETLKEQLDSVLEIVKKINTYSINELIEMKKEMEDILVHNKNMFLHYIKNPILNL